MSENDLSVSEIADALSQDPGKWARAILEMEPTKKSGRELRFFEKGGLVVFLAGPRRGQFWNFGENVGGDMIDLHQYWKGSSKGDAVEWAKSQLGITSRKTLPDVPKRDRERERKEIQDEEKRRLKVANFLWRTAKPAAGTPAEAYLRNRGIDRPLPDCVAYRRLDRTALEKMGLDEQVPDGELDAACFRATNAKGETRAVQQVLIRDGAKANKAIPGLKDPKRTNGLMDGAAVKFGAPDDELALAEGPETGASWWCATEMPTWIVLGTFNMTRVEIPDSVRRIVIVVDLEEAGNGLAQAVWAAGHWQAKGYEVRLAVPKDRTEGDFNDVHQEEGADAVRAALVEAVRPPVIRENGPRVIVRDPRDALAIWRSTGLQVMATVKPLAPYRHLDGVERAILVGAPGEPVDLQDWSAPECARYFEVTTSALSAREVHELGGPDAVVRLMRMAAPLGKRFVYGLEALALKPDAPVILAQSKRGLQAARRLFPEAAVIAHKINGVGAADYHWTPLRGRDVVIAPTENDRHLQEAEIAAAAIAEAGAARVRILSWPTCVKTASGWWAVRPAIPRGYDFAQAWRDGWRAPFGHALLGMARPYAPDARAAA